MADHTGVLHRGGERSAADIVQNVVRDLQEIVRSEIRLAKTEFSEKVSQVSKAGALFGAAAVAGLLGGMALVASMVALLALWLPVWGSALAVAALLAAAALILYKSGRSRLARFTPVPEQTVETLNRHFSQAGRSPACRRGHWPSGGLAFSETKKIVSVWASSGHLGACPTRWRG